MWDETAVCRIALPGTTIQNLTASTNTTHAIVKSTKEKCPSVGRRTPRTRNKVRRERLSTMVRKDVEEREDFREGDRHRVCVGVKVCIHCNGRRGNGDQEANTY